MTNAYPSRACLLHAIVILAGSVAGDQTVATAVRKQHPPLPIVSERDNVDGNRLLQDEHEGGNSNSNNEILLADMDFSAFVNGGNDDSLDLNLREGRVKLPDISLNRNVLGVPLQLNLTNMVCRDIDFGHFSFKWQEEEDDDDASEKEKDLQQSMSRQSKNRSATQDPNEQPQQHSPALRATFRLTGLDLSCSVDFETSWTFFSGQGSVNFVSLSNRIETQMIFQPPELLLAPMVEQSMSNNAGYEFVSNDEDNDNSKPQMFSMEQCDANFRVASINFEQSENLAVAVFVLNALEFIVQDTVEQAMETASCKIAMGTQGVVQNMLSNVTQQFQTFYYNSRQHRYDSYLSDSNNDKSTTETNNSSSHVNNAHDNTTLVNFKEPKTFIARMLAFGFRTMGKLLGKRGEGADADLFINTALRTFLNSEDGSFAVPLPENGISIMNSNFTNSFGSLLTVKTRTTTNSSSDDSTNSATIMDLPRSAYKLFGITDAKINKVQIYGLDNFLSFDGFTFDDEQNQTIHVNLALSSISVTIQGQIEMEGGPKSKERNFVSDKQYTNKTIHIQPFGVQVGLKDFNASASVLLALDETVLAQLRVGKLLTLEEILCQAFPAIHNFQFVQLMLEDSLDIQLNMSSTFVSESNQQLSPAAEMLATMLNSGILEFGLALYKDIVIEALPELLRQTMPGLVEGMATDFTEATCSDESIFGSNNDRLVDFRDLLLPSERAYEYGATGMEPYGNLISMAKEFIDENLLKVEDNSTGLLRMNERVIRVLTEQQTSIPGTFIFNGAVFDVQQGILLGEELDMKIGLAVSEVRVDNLDTFAAPTALLDPQVGQASRIYNMVQLGLPWYPIRVKANLDISVTVNDEMKSRNQVKLEMATDSIALLVTAAVELMEKRFLNFPLEDVLDIQCWLAALAPTELNIDGKRVNGTSASLSLPELDLSVGDWFQFNISCLECSGPTAEWVINLANKFDDEDSFALPNEVIKAVLSLFAEGDSSLFQTQMDRMLVDAPKYCRHHPDYDPNIAPGLRPVIIDVSHLKSTSDESVSFLVAVLAVAALSILGFAAAAIVLYTLISFQYNIWLFKLPHAQVLALQKAAKQENDKRLRLNSLSGPIFKSEQVPVYMKVLVPVVILASAALFLWGIIGEAVMVTINVQVGGRSVYAAEMPFTVANVAKDAWTLGGKGLAIFVIVGSGMWPQLKQFGTLVLWFLPPSLLPVHVRGLAFHIFDFLGKWTMASVFLFFIAVAVFRFEITSPQHLLMEDLYKVDILLVPHWGLYATSIAQVLALVASRVCIHYHCRIIVASSTPPNDDLPTGQKDQDGLAEQGKLSVIVADRKAHGVECCADIKTGQASHDLLLVESSMSRDAMEVSLARTNDSNFVLMAAWTEERLGEKTTDVLVEKPRALIYSRINTNARLMKAASRVIIFGIGCSIPILVVTGCLFPSFYRDIRGFLRVIMDRTNESEAFSVFSTTARFMQHGMLLNSAWHFVGHLWLASLLVGTVCVIPVVQTLLLLIRWFWWPQREEKNRKTGISTTDTTTASTTTTTTTTAATTTSMDLVLQVLQTCQSIEVFLLSAVMFALELGGITNTIAPSMCQPVESLTSAMASYGLLDENDVQCFSYNGSVEYGSILLLIGVLLLYFLSVVLSQPRQVSGKSTSSSLLLLVGQQGGSITKDEDSRISSTKVIADIAEHNPFFFSVFQWMLSCRVLPQELEHETDDSSTDESVHDRHDENNRTYSF